MAEAHDACPGKVALPDSHRTTGSGPKASPTRPKGPPRKPPRGQMPGKEARAFIEALAEATPDPVTELHYKDPYTLLVAVVLSAQATDASVNRVTTGLYRIADTPAAMVALGVDEVARHVRSIGLWKTKAQNVVALSQQLLDHHGGQVPEDRDKLEALPGVGRKTANVVLNVAFSQATMAVDTHVFRVSNRTGLAPGATPRAVEDGLMKRIPPDRLGNAHHWLILHGRYVCKARRPECWRCVGAPWCRYQPKTSGPADPAGTDVPDA